tara:strand:+ start:45736 stop:51408 length:5673 start_codon:yes stop_codon:yes gene_type:complete
MNNNKINLQLGDIIEIDSPSNDFYDKKIFFINYIDNKKINLISENIETTLLIDDNGNFLEESIDNFILLYRNKFPGYIKQNNLKINQKISIYFNGTKPFIINGIITNIEEDMLELTIEDSEEVIYIDFAYSGIPDNLNIEKIVIRDEKVSLEKEKEKEKEDEIIENSINEDNSKIDLEDDDFDIIHLNTQNYVIMDEIDLEEELDEIYYSINVSDDEKRYSLEEQINDYLNYNIGLIKPENLNQEKIEYINKEINRYIELRDLYSDYDENRNVKLPTLKNEFDKPLKDIVLNLNKKIYWILPVISNKKNIFINSEDYNDSYDDFVLNNNFNIFLKNLETLIESWRKNNSKEKFNDYKKYINDLYEMFDSNILKYENYSEVNCNNIDVINDTYDNFYSYCVNKGNINKEKFVMDVYNQGINMLEMDFINGKKTLNPKKLTENDKIKIISFITLPLPIFSFSQINSNYINIFDKSILDKAFLKYDEIFKLNINKYLFNQEDIELFKNTDKNIHDNNIFKNINSFELINKLDDEDTNYKNNLDNLLESFIPSNNVFIKTIFDNYNIYNLSDLLKYLQCANIDYYNIHSNSFDIIKSELKKNSNKFKLDLISHIQELKILINNINKNLNSSNNNYSFSLLNKELKDELLLAYKIDEKIINNNEEFLNKIIDIDDGNFLNICIKKSNIDLIVSNLLDNFIKHQKKIEKNSIELEKENTCEKFVLSKKYNNIEEIEEDNNKLIYYDAKFDKTLYSFINDYENEKKSMDTETFKTFLKKEIIEKLNLTEEKAEREAKSIIGEKREIINGDYAVLINKEDNKNYIYIRDEDIWKIDENFKDNFYIDSNKIFCDTNQKCLNVNDKCENIDIIKNKLDKNNIDEILKSFDLKYNISIEEIKGKINDEYTNSKNLLNKIHNINNENNENINNLLLKLNKVNSDIVLKSPNEFLRDRILSYPDIIKKNYYIRIFAKNCLRYANDGEDNNWLYCKKINIKILPLFLLKLANVFDNKSQYLIELDTICSEQGTISDDNSYWVDKHSGYIIKRIEFNNDEGYDESGYKLNTKEVLDTDYALNIENKIVSEETKMINNIIKTIGQMLGINILNYKEQIHYNVLKILKKKIPDKKSYEEKIDKLKKKDAKAKNLPNYEDACNNILLLLTVCFIIIYIQTNIPSLTTKKTFPGCIKSFSGFPLSGEEDKTFITYIACVMNKIKSSIKPWNTILKVSENNIIRKIESLLKDDILKDDKINEILNKKKQYLLENPEIEYFEENFINSLYNFMPPLIDFKIKSSDITPLASNFGELMIENFKKKNNNNYIDILNGKIIFITNDTIERIQNIIKKKSPILESNNGEPYMENACCNSENNSINFFIKEDKIIDSNNSLIFNYEKIIKDIKTLESCTILFHNENTKNIFPKLSNDFSEETIYKTFIFYCNFNNNNLIDNNIKPICNSKPIGINYDEDINSIIENIKEQGKNFNNEALLNLIDIINKKNIKYIDNSIQNLNNIEELRNIINNYNNDTLIEKFDDIFIDKFYKLIDNYDIIKFNEEDSNDIKNYLYRVNNIMKNNIMLNLKNIDTLSKQEFENFEKKINISFNNNNFYLFKNYLIDLIKIFPNIVCNKSINYSGIPKHWNLSDIHNNDIYNILKKYYSNFLNFNNINILKIVFNYINDKYSIFIKLSEKIVYYEEILINKDEKISSIFDINLLNMIYNYFYLNIFNEFFNILENNDIELSISSLDDSYNKNEIYKNIFDFLNNFLNTLHSVNNDINNSYKKIKENITFSKEKEKDLITDYLKNLTDEEREIENLFKNNKLEKWNKGMQKGVTQYVKENYDEERIAIEKQAILEKKLNKKDFITDMNKEIFLMEMEEEEVIQNDIEEDAYDMNDIADDDDYESEDEY